MNLSEKYFFFTEEKKWRKFTEISKYSLKAKHIQLKMQLLSWLAIKGYDNLFLNKSNNLIFISILYQNYRNNNSISTSIL